MMLLNFCLASRLPAIRLGSIWSLLFLLGQVSFAAEAEGNAATTAELPGIILVDIGGQNSVQHFNVFIHKNNHQEDNQLRLAVIPVAERQSSYLTSKSWYGWAANNVDAARLKPLLPKGDEFGVVAVSPDEKLVALSIKKHDEYHRAGEIIVVDKMAGNIVARKVLSKDRSVADMCWNPDSSAIAIVEASSRTGKSLLGLVSSFAGHPIPYNDFFVAVFIIASKDWAEVSTPIVSDLKYGAGYISWKSGVGMDSPNTLPQPIWSPP